MKKAVIFGAGGTGKALNRKLVKENTYEVVAFLDNDPDKAGGFLSDIKIYKPKDFSQIDYDMIFIGSAISPDGNC